VTRERVTGALLATAGFLFIAAATLTSLPGDPYTLPHTCIICGQLAGVDITNNVIMFVPYGAGLALAGGRRWLALVVIIATTLAVETLQIGVVIGRDANVGDVVMNTVGGIAGIALAGTWRAWIFPAPRAARRLARAGAVVWVAVLAGTGWALQRTAPGGPYLLANVLPNLDAYSVYRGRVLASALGGVPLPSGVVPDGAELRRRALLDTMTVSARVTTGSLPRQLAVVAIAFAPDHGELFALGQRERDLVFRVRLNADRIRLRAPSATVPNAFPFVPPWPASTRFPSDTLELAGGVRDRMLYAQATGGGTPARREVALVPTLGWSLFLPFRYSFGPELPVLTSLWVAGLLLPAGYWGARASRGNEGGAGPSPARREWAWLALTVVIGLGVIPAVAGLHAARWWEWSAAVAGAAGGWALTSRARGFLMRRSPLLLAGAFALAACAPRRRPPEPATGPAASAGYTCAYRHLRDLGYTVTRAAPESGVVAGERAAGGALTERAGWDELVVRAPIGVRERGAVRVTARGGVLEGGRRRAAAASARAVAHAEAITRACRDTRPSRGR